MRIVLSKKVRQRRRHVGKVEKVERVCLGQRQRIQERFMIYFDVVLVDECVDGVHRL